MRPVIGIVLLVCAAIGIAIFATRAHPGGDLPPAEQQAQQDAADASAAREKADKQKSMVNHESGAFDAVKAGAIHATLTFEGKAPIGVELYPAAAPKTVAQISGLIKDG